MFREIANLRPSSNRHVAPRAHKRCKEYRETVPLVGRLRACLCGSGAHGLCPLRCLVCTQQSSIGKEQKIARAPDNRCLSCPATWVQTRGGLPAGRGKTRRVIGRRTQERPAPRGRRGDWRLWCVHGKIEVSPPAGQQGENDGHLVHQTIFTFQLGGGIWKRRRVAGIMVASSQVL